MPKRRKRLVFGYIHELEKKLKLGQVIPLRIIYECILYSTDEDHFEDGNKYFKLKHHNRTMKKINPEGFMKFMKGTQIFSLDANIIATWKLEVEASGYVIIGLWKQTNRCDVKISWRTGGCLSNYDQVTLILDLKKRRKEVRCKINDGEMQTYNLRLDYNKKENETRRFCANLAEKGDYISILDFNIEY